MFALEVEIPAEGSRQLDVLPREYPLFPNLDRPRTAEFLRIRTDQALSRYLITAGLPSTETRRVEQSERESATGAPTAEEPKESVFSAEPAGERIGLSGAAALERSPFSAPGLDEKSAARAVTYGFQQNKVALAAQPPQPNVDLLA